MPDAFRMPDTPTYFIRKGLPVYMVRSRWVNVRKQKPKDVLFILHDTAGRDSRQELYDSTRKVSVHYLVGKYDGKPAPVVIKYMSEFDNYANGAGNGRAGGIPNGLNPASVQFEIEYANMDGEILNAYIDTIAQSMRIWRNEGSNIILAPHRLFDKNKYDPRIDWNYTCSEIYKRSLFL